MSEEVFTLWFRKDRSQPWRLLFAGGSSQACTDALAESKCGSGDYYTKRGADRPKGGSLCWGGKPKGEGDG